MFGWPWGRPIFMRDCIEETVISNVFDLKWVVTVDQSHLPIGRLTKSLVVFYKSMGFYYPHRYLDFEDNFLNAINAGISYD